MRVVLVGVALLAVGASATSIRANMPGTDPAGMTDPPEQGGPAANIDVPFAREKQRQDTIQLAQAGTAPVTKYNWKATTGDPSVAPFKWAGLLEMPIVGDPKMANFCTGQFISPNVVLTAGHCLQDPGLPKGPWPNPNTGKFMLQYQNGQASQTFSIVCGAANPLWTQNIANLWQAVPHDFALVLVNGTSSTGYMHYALDWKGKYTYASRIGYPQDILGGSFIEFAPGILFFGDQLPFAQTQKFGGPPQLPDAVVQWGPITDATHGMSGGAWVANMGQKEDADSNILLAVTSSGPQAPNSEIPVFPGGTWAAYLKAAEFNPVFNYVQNGCKGTLPGAPPPPAEQPAQPVGPVGPGTNPPPGRSAQ